MKKRSKKGFTLVELLAVIVILGILLTIATTAVIKNINKSKENARYVAAKELVEFAEAYMSVKNTNEVTVSSLYDEGYLEDNSTNPITGKNDLISYKDYITVYKSNYFKLQKKDCNKCNSSLSVNANKLKASASNDNISIETKIRMFDGYAIAYDVDKDGKIDSDKKESGSIKQTIEKELNSNEIIVYDKANGKYIVTNDLYLESDKKTTTSEKTTAAEKTTTDEKTTAVEKTTTDENNSQETEEKKNSIDYKKILENIIAWQKRQQEQQKQKEESQKEESQKNNFETTTTVQKQESSLEKLLKLLFEGAKKSYDAIQELKNKKGESKNGPILTLKYEEVYLEKGVTLEKQTSDLLEKIGATAYDKKDGDITSKVEVSYYMPIFASNAKIYYSVTNSDGITSTISQKVILIEPTEIYWRSVNIPQGENLEDDLIRNHIKIRDYIDGSMLSKIADSKKATIDYCVDKNGVHNDELCVNTNKPGVYYAKYSYKNSLGMEAFAVGKINVVEKTTITFNNDTDYIKIGSSVKELLNTDWYTATSITDGDVTKKVKIKEVYSTASKSLFDEELTEPGDVTVTYYVEDSLGTFTATHNVVVVNYPSIELSDENKTLNFPKNYKLNVQKDIIEKGLGPVATDELYGDLTDKITYSYKELLGYIKYSVTNDVGATSTIIQHIKRVNEPIIKFKSHINTFAGEYEFSDTAYMMKNQDLLNDANLYNFFVKMSFLDLTNSLSFTKNNFSPYIVDNTILSHKDPNVKIDLCSTAEGNHDDSKCLNSGESGRYYIKYTYSVIAGDTSVTGSSIRSVVVVDPPTIEFEEDVLYIDYKKLDHHFLKTFLKYKDPFDSDGNLVSLEKSYSAKSLKDGYITYKVKIDTSNVESKPGRYQAKYSVTDSLGQTTEVMRNVIIYSNPVLYVDGQEVSGTVYYKEISKNEFHIPTVQAYDVVDGDITYKIEKTGDYNLQTKINDMEDNTYSCYKTCSYEYYEPVSYTVSSSTGKKTSILIMYVDKESHDLYTQCQDEYYECISNKKSENLKNWILKPWIDIINDLKEKSSDSINKIQDVLESSFELFEDDSDIEFEESLDSDYSYYEDDNEGY